MQDLGDYRWDEGTPHPDAPSGSSAFLRVLHSLRRRWVLFTLVWALPVAAAVAYLMTLKPSYRPQATLEVRPEMSLVPADASDAAYAASLSMWTTFYRTQEALLRSPGLVQAVLKSLPKPVTREYGESPDPVRTFSEHLDIEKTESSYIMKVGFIDADPEHATEIVNTLVSLYLRDANRRLRELKDEALAVLSNETLPAIRQRFDEAEIALQAFQAETGFADFEEQYVSLVEARRRVAARLSEIRLRGFRIRSDLVALQGYAANGPLGLYHEAFHITRSLEPLAIQRAALSAELAKQGESLKEKHPRLIELGKELDSVEARIREVVQGTLKSFETNLASLEQEERSLATEEKRIEQQMGKSRQHLTDFKRLVAEVTTSQELYNSYLKRQNETRATSASGQAGVRVIDLATLPREPYKKPRWFLHLSIVAGILLGAGAVLMAEQADDRIKSVREVEVFLGLDVLGEIPKLKEDKPGKEKPLVLSEDSDPAEVEAFQALRAQLITRFEDTPSSKVIMVTSAEAGEGKTTIAANLAQVLATQERRVLLLDAELRQPSMKSLLADPRGMGLEELLRGEALLQEAAQPSRIPGVDVLGADEELLGAADMASSPRFRLALKTARERYDFIVIDSAPLNLISESVLIARRADATVLVVRLGVTSRTTALAAQKKLADMKVKILGAVVNGTRPSASFHGYRNRRGVSRGEAAIVRGGDDLIGIA
jgi:capsular exopolysaccharide synthesis family protein